MPQFTFLPATETSEISEDIRRLFEDLAASLRHDQRAYSGECHPSIDVLETDQAVHIVVDIPGVPKAALRVLFRAGVVVVAGEKAPPHGDESQAFHLVEREFGRFARAIRLNGAFDIVNSRASLRNGELMIVLPKIPDRRGQAHEIQVA
jgi:HSP20 family protein